MTRDIATLSSNSIRPSRRRTPRRAVNTETAQVLTKGLSRLGGEASLLEGDQPAGELEQGEVVLVLLRPADEQRPVAVEPGVAGLHDPAAGTPPGRAQLELDLFAARTDVRREAALVGERVHPGVVVAAVETQALRLLRGRLGPLDRDRVERRG